MQTHIRYKHIHIIIGLSGDPFTALDTFTTITTIIFILLHWLQPIRWRLDRHLSRCTVLHCIILNDSNNVCSNRQSLPVSSSPVQLMPCSAHPSCLIPFSGLDSVLLVDLWDQWFWVMPGRVWTLNRWLTFLNKKNDFVVHTSWK